MTLKSTNPMKLKSPRTIRTYPIGEGSAFQYRIEAVDTEVGTKFVVYCERIDGTGTPLEVDTFVTKWLAIHNIKNWIRYSK